MSYLEHFRARVIQDAVNEALAATWDRRRQALLAARPRAGDFHGRATREQLRERFEILTAAAEACRARAVVSIQHDEIDADVWECAS